VIIVYIRSTDIS